MLLGASEATLTRLGGYSLSLPTLYCVDGMLRPSSNIMSKYLLQHLHWIICLLLYTSFYHVESYLNITFGRMWHVANTYSICPFTFNSGIFFMLKARRLLALSKWEYYCITKSVWFYCSWWKVWFYGVKVISKHIWVGSLFKSVEMFIALAV